VDAPLIVLLPGERLLWSGRPQRIVPTGLEWYRLVFGSVLVSVFAATGLPFPDGRISFFGVVVVTFGFAIAWGPVIVRLWATRRAVYAVTDQRVVVADRVSGRIRVWADLGFSPPTVTPLGHDGLGTLTFPTPGGTVNIGGHSAPVRHRPPPIELVAVPEAEGLRDLIVQEQGRG
jgi:hypothetical protein